MYVHIKSSSALYTHGSTYGYHMSKVTTPAAKKLVLAYNQFLLTSISIALRITTITTSCTLYMPFAILRNFIIILFVQKQQS